MKKITFSRIVILAILLTISVVTALSMTNRSKYVFNSEQKKSPIYCVDTSEKKVAISFDASWGDDNTMQILDILNKNNVKATFFLVGGWIDDYPNIVKEIYNNNHEIGNHSDMHPDMTKISKDKIIEEIAITDGKVRSITGQGTKLFRCPSGSYNNTVIDTVKITGHYCIQWNVDSIDWKEQGKDIEYERVMKKVKPGSIILFHNNAKYTPENLPRIIRGLKERGYSFVKVGDLIYKDNYYINNIGKQIKNGNIKKIT